MTFSGREELVGEHLIVSKLMAPTLRLLLECILTIPKREFSKLLALFLLCVPVDGVENLFTKL